MEVWDGEEFMCLNNDYREVWRPIENGNGLEPGWIKLFWVPKTILNETIRIQPGSNIFVAAMEVWDGEEFIVWTKNIGKFGVP